MIGNRLKRGFGSFQVVLGAWQHQRIVRLWMLMFATMDTFTLRNWNPSMANFRHLGKPKLEEEDFTIGFTVHLEQSV